METSSGQAGLAGPNSMPTKVAPFSHCTVGTVLPWVPDGAPGLLVLPLQPTEISKCFFKQAAAVSPLCRDAEAEGGYHTSEGELRRNQE